MGEIVKLLSFTKGFLGVTDQHVQKCLTTIATTHHISENDAAKVIVDIINSNKQACLSYSKDKSLFDYQRKVVEKFYTHRGTIAAFATGTGKTLTATSAAACVHNLAKTLGRTCNVLVVTPASLVDNMKGEFNKFNYDFGEDLSIISSNIFRDILLYKKRIRQGVKPDADKFMLANFKRTTDVACNKNTFLIVDEAHEFKTDYLYVFDEPTFRSNNPDDIESRAKMFVEECYPYVWKILLLTATPMLNRWYDVMNLIAAVKGVNPKIQSDKIKTSSATLDVSGTSFSNAVGTKGIAYEKIMLMDPSYFRGVITFRDIDKTDANFPTRNPEIYEPVYMTDMYYIEVEKLIDEISRKRPRRKAQSDEQIQKELEAMQKKLAKLPNNPKIDVVSSILSTDKYDKVLIYSRFLDPLNGLKDELERRMSNNRIPKFETFIITGQDVPPSKRHAYLQTINDAKRAIVFVSDAGGMGLDFKGLESVIIYEPGINLSREEQAIGRAVRFRSHSSLPKHKQRVDIYKLIMRFPTYVRDKITPDQSVAIRAQEKDFASRSFRELLIAVNSSFHTPTPLKIDSSPW